MTERTFYLVCLAIVLTVASTVFFFDRRLDRIEHTGYTCARDIPTQEVVCVRPEP